MNAKKEGGLMLILLYIFLGFLLFDCLVACCPYFRKENPLKQYEEQLDYLLKEKSTQCGKTAKINRPHGFVQQSEVLPFSDLST